VTKSSQPPRRLPKHIYRRRQISCLFLLALLVAVIWGIASLANSLNSGSGSTPGASISAATTAGAGEACAPGAITVKPFVTDKTLTDARGSFGPSETPYFGFSLTNNGTVDCSFNVGSAQQFLTVTSGAEVYWSSKDCDRSATIDKLQVIKVGETLKSQPTSWDRVRSSTTGCSAASGQSAVPAGGATFHLNISVAGVLSEPGQGAFILR